MTDDSEMGGEDSEDIVLNEIGEEIEEEEKEEGEGEEDLLDLGEG